jgi:hypothetical protein
VQDQPRDQGGRQYRGAELRPGELRCPSPRKAVGQCLLCVERHTVTITPGSDHGITRYGLFADTS